MTDTATGTADPIEDPRAFRRALGQYATGVSVVTTMGEVPVGMTANSFAAVSLDPPLVLWSIRKESRSRDAFTSAGHFAVNVLADDQLELSQLFGRPHEDQFSATRWRSGMRGAPLFPGCLAHFECETHEIVDAGDHLILIGRVLGYASHEGAPLLFAQGAYGVVDRPSRLEHAPIETLVQGGAEGEDALFLSLVKAADQHMSRLFHQHRQQVGVTEATGRVLNLLAQAPCGVEDLEDAGQLGWNATQDALDTLVASGHVRRRDDAWELTESGRSLRSELRTVAEAFTADQLDGIPARDVETARRVMAVLLSRESTS